MGALGTKANGQTRWVKRPAVCTRHDHCLSPLRFQHDTRCTDAVEGKAKVLAVTCNRGQVGALWQGNQMCHILCNRAQRDLECATRFGQKNLRIVIGIPVGNAGYFCAVFDSDCKSARIGRGDPRSDNIAGTCDGKVALAEGLDAVSKICGRHEFGPACGGGCDDTREHLTRVSPWNWIAEIPICGAIVVPGERNDRRRRMRSNPLHFDHPLSRRLRRGLIFKANQREVKLHVWGKINSIGMGRVHIAEGTRIPRTLAGIACGNILESRHNLKGRFNLFRRTRHSQPGYRHTQLLFEQVFRVFELEGVGIKQNRFLRGCQRRRVHRARGPRIHHCQQGRELRV